MIVAVIGGGTMGNGIAQLSGLAGHTTCLVDISDAQLEAATTGISRSLQRMIKAEKITEHEAEDALARVTTCTDIGAAVDGASVIIEAVPERLELKNAVFEKVLSSAPPNALLGTNTSQLSITAIGSALGDRASRLVGMHFFNPPVMMKLVELVRGIQTGDEALAEAKVFAEGLGKQVVVCQRDSPGFLTSRISAILRMECLHMLEEGLASPADIDTAVRLAFNHPMGPLELGDFNGLDTYLDALEGLHRAHGERFRPPVVLRNMVAAGRFGRKSGEGFYSYRDESEPGEH